MSAAFPKRVGFIDEPYLAWVRKNAPCILGGRNGHQCWTPRGIEACHVIKKSRGRDDRMVFGGCAIAHGEQEGQTPQFEAKYGVSIVATAKALRQRYEEEHPSR